MESSSPKTKCESNQSKKRKNNTIDAFLQLSPVKAEIKYDKTKQKVDIKEKKEDTQNKDNIIKDEVKEESTDKNENKIIESKITTTSTVSQSKRLERDFYTKEVVELSKELLGKIIVRKTDEGEIRLRIVETEAYKAPDDKACHAYGNKKTDKTKYFWQIGGCLYVFMIYGHNCVNITAATEKEPEAVLIRALEPVYNINIIKNLRNCKKVVDLGNGPGKCGGALNITLAHNGTDLCTSDDIYLIEDEAKPKFEIGVSKRINIDYAEEWIDKPWRFFIKNNKYVSKPSTKKK